jgi:hypothetical protein
MSKFVLFVNIVDKSMHTLCMIGIETFKASTLASLSMHHGRRAAVPHSVCMKANWFLRSRLHVSSIGSSFWGRALASC